MESQTRGIGTMPCEIVLCIAEHMDTATRLSFMASTKRFYTLIKENERSICKNRLATFVLAPIGNVLSSSESDERRILQNYTFPALHEFELRDNRINDLLEALTEMYAEMPSLRSLPAPLRQGQVSLRTILRKALYQCDRIADIAANGCSPPISQRSYWAILDGIYELEIAFESVTEELSRLNPLTRPLARPSQLEYMLSLPTEDLCALYLMVTMFGLGRTRRQPMRPQTFERRVIVEENIMRHGTWFLWSHMLGDPGAAEVAGCVTAATRAEIRHWEFGGVEHMPKGFKMSLTVRLGEVFGDDDDGAGFKLGVMNAVCPCALHPEDDASATSTSESDDSAE